MKKKYTRKSAMDRLLRNGTEIKRVKKTPQAKEKNPYPKPYTLYYVSTHGLGIGLQGTADYLIKNFYDVVRSY